MPDSLPDIAADLVARTAYLAQFASAERLARIEEVLARRTRYATLVLEDVFDPRNASAVIRSCECLGFQELHVIENRSPFRPCRRIVRGAAKWMDLYRHDAPGVDNTDACFQQLRARGYRIAAATLQEGERSVPVADVPLDQPLAVCFGTEQTGLSPRAHDLADCFVQVPMAGFTQSFNISVSAAICAYELGKRIRQADVPWQLKAEEIARLRYRWLTQSIRNWDAIMARYSATRP